MRLRLSALVFLTTAALLVPTMGAAPSDSSPSPSVDAGHVSRGRSTTIQLAQAEPATPPVPDPRPDLRSGFFPSGSQPLMGERRIRAFVRGTKVEIRDRFGQNIHVRIERVAEPKAEPVEYSAPSLTDLRAKHPEAAQWFDRLAVTR